MRAWRARRAVSSAGEVGVSGGGMVLLAYLMSIWRGFGVLRRWLRGLLESRKVVAVERVEQIT